MLVFHALMCLVIDLRGSSTAKQHINGITFLSNRLGRNVKSFVFYFIKTLFGINS